MIGSADAITPEYTISYHTWGEPSAPSTSDQRGNHNITSLAEQDAESRNMQNSSEDETGLQKVMLGTPAATGVRATHRGGADITDAEPEKDMVQTNGAEPDGRTVRSATLSVAEAAEFLGLSLSRAYEAFRRGGELESCSVRVATRQALTLHVQSTNARESCSAGSRRWMRPPLAGHTCPFRTPISNSVEVLLKYSRIAPHERP
jgi:hypothetical protein